MFHSRIFPPSRLATIDIGALSRSRHHVHAMLEVDVTTARERIREWRRKVGELSFLAWTLAVIGATVREHPEVAAYRVGRRRVLYSDSISVSIVVEKVVDGAVVPLPVLLPDITTLSPTEITQRLRQATDSSVVAHDLVLHRSSTFGERIYVLLPAFLRRLVWRALLASPKRAHALMGNVAVTSLTSAGAINGWFLPLTVHPLCIGLGSVLRKPVAHGDQLVIREVLNLTVLMDHDVIDGAPMARFIRALTRAMERGDMLEFS